MVSSQFHYTKRNRFMPFLLAEILNFQGSTHRIGVGSFSNIDMNLLRGNALSIWAGRKTRVHQTAGKTPATFVLWRNYEGTNGQVADLICTLKLTELKMLNHLLFKSEKYFFGDERTLKKNYLKPLTKKEL